MTLDAGTFKIVYERVQDPYSMCEDFDLSPEEWEQFRSGRAGFVGLRAVVLVEGRAVAEETLYGIRECAGRPCAFEDGPATSWLTGEVLGRCEGVTPRATAVL